MGPPSPYEVTSLQYVGQEEMPFSTSLGVDMGDSADDIKEALGEPASESADRYSYGLERGEDGYTLFTGTEEAFYQYAGGEGDPYNQYMANFTLEDGKVAEFSVTSCGNNTERHKKARAFQRSAGPFCSLQEAGSIVVIVLIRLVFIVVVIVVIVVIVSVIVIPIIGGAVVVIVGIPVGVPRGPEEGGAASRGRPGSCAGGAAASTAGRPLAVIVPAAAGIPAGRAGRRPTGRSAWKNRPRCFQRRNWRRAGSPPGKSQ